MFTYRITPLAKSDMMEIRQYIREKLSAPESATKLMEDLQQAFCDACRFPKSIQPVNDPLLRAKGYRKIIVRNFIAYILIDDDHEFVDVMRVLYYARDYTKLL